MVPDLKQLLAPADLIAALPLEPAHQPVSAMQLVSANPPLAAWRLIPAIPLVPALLSGEPPPSLLRLG
jgi:hypothetical protein